MHIMFLPLKRYFDFQGRSRRKEFWLWVLFQFLVGIAFGIAKAIIEPANPVGTIFILQMVFALAILIPNIAVAVRRFHDINRTGWWYVLPLVVMIVAAIVYFSVHGAGFVKDVQALSEMGTSPSPEQSMAVMQTFLAPMLWIYLPAVLAAIVTFVFNVLDGTPGPNRFGADPKGRGNISVF